jgi:peptidoglycan hydrolase-like protein with peptidoglycan-binding domain
MNGRRSPLARRRALAGAALVVAAVAVVAIVALDPFGGTPASSAAGSPDNGASTSSVTVVRRDLSSQTQVSATLGYADASTISVPSGTAPSNVQQAQQAVTSARSTLEGAQTTLSSDQQALERVRATLAADRRKLAVDCGGDNAAEAGGGGTGGSNGNAGPCAGDAQALATDQQGVTDAAAKVQADRQQVAGARTALASASQSLAAAESSAAAYDQSAVYTMLPPVGRVVRRGQPLYAIGGEPVVLLYGPTSAWRAFAPGMSDGDDVAELNANLRALGYGAPSGRTFTSGTEAAIRAFQSARGMQATGRLLLGSVVFDAGALRVTSVTPTAGAPVQAGPVLGTTSTRRVVKIALDASQQASVKVGDPVVITLPDNSTTPGHVSSVGTVATTPSGDQGGNGSSTPTVDVLVEPDHPAATGRLDQASVDVSITTGTVKNVLAIPVNALVALAGGGYAVELIEAGGIHRLVGVEVGLFDDAEGLVEVTGSGLAGGQHVVVPST